MYEHYCIDIQNSFSVQSQKSSKNWYLQCWLFFYSRFFVVVFLISLCVFTDKKDCKHGLSKLSGSFISGIYSASCFLRHQEIYVDINLSEISSTKHAESLFNLCICCSHGKKPKKKCHHRKLFYFIMAMRFLILQQQWERCPFTAPVENAVVYQKPWKSLQQNAASVSTPVAQKGSPWCAHQTHSASENSGGSGNFGCPTFARTLHEKHGCSFLPPRCEDAEWVTPVF